MKTFSVEVATSVQAYGTFKVLARSAKHAELRVNKMIDNGDTYALENEVVYKTQWDTKEAYRVVPNCAHEVHPPPTKQAKNAVCNR
jgi:hypothetical protein